MSNPSSTIRIPFRSLQIKRLSMDNGDFPLNRNEALLALDDLTQTLQISRTSANSDNIISSRVHAFLYSVASLFRGKLELTITRDVAGGRRFDSVIDWMQSDSIHVGVAKVMSNMDISIVLERIKNPLQQSLIEKATSDTTVDVPNLVTYGLVTDSRTWYLVRCNLVRTTRPGRHSEQQNLASFDTARVNGRQMSKECLSISCGC
ncbi:MAG: hypothetical protein J3Q66DRAFT_398084 [Benniella sp.]|nr:MAG: hypothetical protein J3Q66DRAFT_398084 [Benniella sp.]